MPARHFVVPGDPDTLTGGFVYDRRIVEGLRAAGWPITVHALPNGFPNPDAAGERAAETALAGIPDGDTVVVDGLALGVLPDLMSAHADRLCLVALVHHPLALETGLTEDERTRLADTERKALAHVKRVIVTSPKTARELSDYHVVDDDIGIVLPGTDPAPLASRSSTGDSVLLCVATLTPRKGHSVLLRALATLGDRRWRLTCVGGAEHSPDTAAGLYRLAETLDLADRVRFVGPATGPALEDHYRETDIFVLPSHYEGFGMVLTEAVARGLPIISTTAGAIPDTVPAGAGLLVPPGDAEALAGALAAAMDDKAVRDRLAAASRQARARLPTWPDAATRFAAELDGAETA